jgi:hypothetical protein
MERLVTIAGTMQEVIALEALIMKALPAADHAADTDPNMSVVVRFAHDVLCNGWSEPQGTRLDRLRTIAAELRRFAV